VRVRSDFLALLVAVLGSVLAWPRAAAACATCSCGDPTITSMGTEQSYAGRLRVSLGYSHRSDAQGEAHVDEEDHDERRLDLSAAYSPTMWLQLAASLPLLERQVTEVDLSRDTLRGTGDLDVRARLTLWRDRHFAPRHLAGVSAGATLPTARVQQGAMGEALDLDHQVGGLAVAPRLGVFYTQLHHPWSIYASLSATHIVSVSGDERAGDNLAATAALQWQPGEVWGLRLAVDGKLEDRGKRGHELLADTGGAAVFVSPGVIYSPVVDLVFEAQVQLPVVNALYGRHDESPVVLIATSYDF
jgi:hypothetical protein